MRAVGTGTHPEGYYLEGQVVDLAELPGGALDPSNQDLIDKGWVRPLDPEDDPGRTKSQIANSIITNDSLANPDDAAVAAKIDPADAYAIVLQGDPEAKFEDLPEAADQVEVTGQATPQTPFNQLRSDAARRDEYSGGGTAASPASAAGSQGSSDDGIDATDGARAYATEKGIDLAQVKGTGDNGRIQKPDVEAYEQEQAGNQGS